MSQEAAEDRRAGLVSLAREARLSQLSRETREQLEQRVTDIYSRWLNDVQEFKDDGEKAALIAEMAVRYIHTGQLLDAADLFICFGWLCSLTGEVTHIRRVFEEHTRSNRDKKADPQYEVGKALLSYHIRFRLGEKISRRETEGIYQDIRDEVTTSSLVLQPHTEIDILHNIMLKHIRLSLFAEAKQMFEEVLAHLHSEEQTTSEIYASYLHNKSRLFARWSESEKRARHEEEAQHLLSSCVEILEECVTHWRKAFKHALPLQEHYLYHKLARALNDYAYRQRLLGNMQIAKESIEESIRLKKACASPPNSLAVSLSEYSQMFLIEGEYRQAENWNGEAVAIMRKAIEDGNTTLDAELGMLLIERASIYTLQARLDEEEDLLKQGIELIGDDPFRKDFNE